MYFVTCSWSFGLRQATFVVIIILLLLYYPRPSLTGGNAVVTTTIQLRFDDFHSSSTRSLGSAKTSDVNLLAVALYALTSRHIRPCIFDAKELCLKTSSAACSGRAASICPLLQVLTWTTTQSFQVGGQRACRWCGSSYTPSVYQVWSL